MVIKFVINSPTYMAKSIKIVTKWISSPYAKQCIMFRAVANVSSCRVYVNGRRGSVQEGSSSGSISLLFPMKVARVHVHSSQGNPQPPALSDSPERYLPHSWARKYKNPCYTCIFSRPFSSLVMLLDVTKYIPPVLILVVISIIIKTII